MRIGTIGVLVTGYVGGRNTGGAGYVCMGVPTFVEVGAVDGCAGLKRTGVEVCAGVAANTS